MSSDCGDGSMATGICDGRKTEARMATNKEQEMMAQRSDEAIYRHPFEYSNENRLNCSNDSWSDGDKMTDRAEQIEDREETAATACGDDGCKDRAEEEETFFAAKMDSAGGCINKGTDMRRRAGDFELRRHGEEMHDTDRAIIMAGLTFADTNMTERSGQNSVEETHKCMHE